jgi:DNA-binding transcriptional ArsR family regulator
MLREAGLVDVRHDAQRRIYGLRPQTVSEIDEWLAPYRAPVGIATGRLA